MSILQQISYYVKQTWPPFLNTPSTTGNPSQPSPQNSFAFSSEPPDVITRTLSYPLIYLYRWNCSMLIISSVSIISTLDQSQFWNFAPKKKNLKTTIITLLCLMNTLYKPNLFLPLLSLSTPATTCRRICAHEIINRSTPFATPSPCNNNVRLGLYTNQSHHLTTFPHPPSLTVLLIRYSFFLSLTCLPTMHCWKEPTSKLQPWVPWLEIIPTCHMVRCFTNFLPHGSRKPSPPDLKSNPTLLTSHPCHCATLAHLCCMPTTELSSCPSAPLFYKWRQPTNTNNSDTRKVIGLHVIDLISY